MFPGRLEADVLRLVSGGAGSGPEGGGAGRMGRLKVSTSFEPLDDPVFTLYSSPSLGRPPDMREALDVRGGYGKRSDRELEE